MKWGYLIAFLLISFSNITGIPVMPFYPVVEHNKARLNIEAAQIDQRKFNDFKNYVASKMD